MRNRLSVIIAVLVCVVFGFLATRQRAQITFPIIVGNTSDTVVAGACVAGMSNPACSLRGAIERANTSDDTSLITFGIPASDPSCSAGVCTINLTSSLPALDANNTVINGPGADKLTVRGASPLGMFPIFGVTASGTVGISGMTIRDGSSSVGGAIVHTGGTLNITNCTIRNNFAIGTANSNGGGIYNGGTLNVTNSTISNNSAGGEVNTAGSGGGIYNAGTLNVTNSTISNNSARGGSGTGGGGIANVGTVNISNSTIRGNSSGVGSAGGGGGGLRNVNGTVSVSNSTISGNTADASPERGGGIFNSGGTVFVKSSIIALNTATNSGFDASGSFDSGGFNLISRRDGSAGFTTLLTDQTGTIAAPLDPMLDPANLRDNGGPTTTIALLAGSPAIDKGTSSIPTGNLTTDQRGAAFPRTFDNPTIPNAAGGNGTDIGAFERQASGTPDFDGDGRTDIGIFRPGVAEWWINHSSTGVTFATKFGVTTDRIVPGNYTGDVKSDIAIWRPSSGEWFVLRSEDFSFFAFPFGAAGDIAAPADYDADGKADAAVFRPSTATWFILRSTGGTTIEAFGANGDVPVPADYDGDGRADMAIFRPSVGQWWLKRSTAGLIATTFGNSSDKPVQGDYTGDGKSDVAFWRPSTGGWFILRSEDLSFFSFPFGANGDTPAPGDYDGDGRHDATVFRLSNATWFSLRSSAGTLIQQFGAPGDRPIPSAFVP